MTSTPYQQENGDYSNKVHQIAQKLIYPRLFEVNPEQLSYEEDTLLAESIRGQMLDGEMAIDRVVKVKVKGLRDNLTFTVQERFRRPKFAKRRDITITEWNHRSNLPSELYKIRADIFLYGYADDPFEPTGFLEVIAVNVTQLLLKIARQEIEYTQECNKKDQTFFAFTFDNLQQANLIIWHDRSLKIPSQAALYLLGRYGASWMSELVAAVSSGTVQP